MTPMNQWTLNRKMYLKEMKIFRPLTEYEQKWLNTVGQNLTCDMFDEEFAKASWWRDHKQFGDKACRLRWTLNRKRYLNEIKSFRPLTKEEQEWLETFGQNYTCNVCDEEFETTRSLRIHKIYYSTELQGENKCDECDLVLGII